ncbi:hypothetical protein M0804_009333 [Polistes exclamans]|nr:hypothetical protein M0804_009333 [Polistes exclamans]
MESVTNVETESVAVTMVIIVDAEISILQLMHRLVSNDAPTLTTTLTTMTTTLTTITSTDTHRCMLVL